MPRWPRPLQLLLGPFVSALHNHPACQPDQFPDGGIHNGHRLPNTAVEGNLSLLQGHIAVQYSKGMPAALPDLDRQSAALRPTFLMEQSHNHTPFSQNRSRSTHSPPKNPPSPPAATVAAKYRMSSMAWSCIFCTRSPTACSSQQ